MASEDQNSKVKQVPFQEIPGVQNSGSQNESENMSKPSSTEREKNRERKERSRPPTKVVVRRLPPTMTLETFVDHVSPLPEHDFIYFVQADMSLGPNAFSRAYINFVHMEDLLTFYEQFDNYMFVDSKGSEYPAVVEFAPFQRVPKKRPSARKEPRIGSLEDEPAFISFVASLEEKNDTSSMKQSSAEHLLALTTESASKKEVTTPLLEFIKQRHAERQRIREEKREERKRKELERKRIREEERKNRRANDSVLKVLRNPEHEDKVDSNKSLKDGDQTPATKKREEDRRTKERDRRDKRDGRMRDGMTKNIRDDRQKHDNRSQRKVQDEHRKTVSDRGTAQNKSSESRHISDNSYNKEAENKKLGTSSRDVQQKKDTTDKFSSNSKDGERSGRQTNTRKSFKENDARRSERNLGNVRESENRRNYGNERKVVHSYSECDARKKIPEPKTNLKSSDNASERKLDTSKSQNLEETDNKKWELLGAKPKRRNAQTSNASANPEKNTKPDDENKKTVINESLSLHTSKTVPEKVNDTGKSCFKDVPGFIIKRRNSLEYGKQVDKNMLGKPKRQISIESETFLKDTNSDNSRKKVSKSQEFDTSSNTSVRISKRNALDSGDHKDNPQSEYMHSSKICAEKKECELKTISKCETSTKDICGSNIADKTNIDESRITEITKLPTKFEEQKLSDNEKIEGSKCNSTSKIDGINDGAAAALDNNKCDLRSDKRMKNKNRPSLEIYRPGMGRFNVQHKEQDKNMEIGSIVEQDSPTDSPSPTLSSRLSNSSKVSKGSQDFHHSLTFKRNVSREK